MPPLLTILLIPLLSFLLAAHVEHNLEPLLFPASSLSSSFAFSSLFLSYSESDTSHDPARVLLLTAHPDDECMFFGPTLTALKRKSSPLSPSPSPSSPVKPKSEFDFEYQAPLQEGSAGRRGARRVEVHSLCLSTGDADGFGAVRRRELARSLDVLGVGASRRRVLDREGLKDDIHVAWDTSVIAEVVLDYVKENNISTILTFDRLGISSHPNHISLFHGTSLALSLNPGQLRAYALLTTPLVQKYFGVLGSVGAKVKALGSIVVDRSGFSRGEVWRRLEQMQRQGQGVADEPGHGVLGGSGHGAYRTSGKSEHTGEGIGMLKAAVVSNAQEYLATLRAMLQHRSQMVWFRWLYVGFSRYMWVNEWVEIVPADERT